MYIISVLKKGVLFRKNEANSRHLVWDQAESDALFQSNFYQRDVTGLESTIRKIKNNMIKNQLRGK